MREERKDEEGIEREGGDGGVGEVEGEGEVGEVEGEEVRGRGGRRGSTREEGKKRDVG